MDESDIDSLLLYCLDISADKIDIRRFEGFSKLGWDKLIQQSVVHGVAPLLCCRIKAAGMDVWIPVEVMENLQRLYISSAIRNTQLCYRFSEVLSALQSAGIPVIALKGVVLAELIYKDIAERPMGDLDILIKPRDIWKADKILSGLGYKSDIKAFVSKHHLRWANNVHYVSDIVSIDVHPVVYNLRNIDPWVNAVPARLAETDTLILGAEDFLIHLCLHLDVHFYGSKLSRLIWCCDIAETIKHYKDKLDWDYIIRSARRHRFEEAIRRVLQMIDGWTGAHVPAEVFSKLKSDGITISISDVMKLARRPTDEHIAVEVDTQIYWLLLSTCQIPSIHNKLYFILRIIFPCRDFLTNRYSIKRSGRLLPYYFIYIWEVVRTIAKCVRRHYLRRLSLA